jgi:hypothetical protein
LSCASGGVTCAVIPGNSRSMIRAPQASIRCVWRACGTPGRCSLPLGSLSRSTIVTRS